MTSNPNRPKRSAENSSLVHTISSGPILADIYRGVTPDGHAYLYYVPARAWRPQSGVRENYSNRFYERNELQIVEVIRKASEWIRQHPRAADESCQRPIEESDDSLAESLRDPSVPSPKRPPTNGRDISSGAA